MLKTLKHCIREAVILPLRILHLTLLPFRILYYFYVLNNIKHRNPQKELILISLIEHLGDIIACEPIARSVREKNPKALIVWGVKKNYKELVSSYPHIDIVLNVSCLTCIRFLSKLNIMNKYYDLHFEEYLCPLCSIPYKKKDGDPSITFDNYFNQRTLLDAFSASSGVTIIDRQPQLQPIPTPYPKEQFMIFHGESNMPQKNWIESSWQELISLIILEYKLTVVEVGLRSVFHHPFSHAQYKNMCGQLSILKTAFIISKSRCFIGIDSGPAHIANAAKVPGIILLSKLNQFDNYMPFSGYYENSQNCLIINAANGIKNLPATEVFNRCKNFITTKLQNSTS